MATKVPLVLLCGRVQRVKSLVHGRRLQHSKINLWGRIGWLSSHTGRKGPGSIKTRYIKSSVYVSRWSGAFRTTGRQLVEERVETAGPLTL